MAIRMTGMISNLDTDAIVKALMAGQTAKKTKVEANKQKLEWKQELWSDMNKKVYNFYKTSLSKIKMQASFKTKTATSSDTSRLTATAGTGASPGAYRVKVKSIASAQYVTSAKLTGANASAGTKLKDLVGNTFTPGTQIKIAAKDGTTYLNVDDNTTVNDFLSAAANAGLNASFDASQQRFFISSKESGEDQKFTITSVQLSPAQQTAVGAWKDKIGYEYLSADDKTAVSKIFDGLQAGTVTYASETGDTLKSYLYKAIDAGVKDYYKKQITEHYDNKYFDGSGNSQTVSSAGRQAAIDSGMSAGDFDALSDAEKLSKVKSIAATKVSEAMESDAVTNAIAQDKAVGITGRTGGNALSVNGESIEIVAASDSFLNTGRAEKETDLTTFAENYASTMSAANNAADQSGANTVLAAMGLGQIYGSAQAENANGTGMVVVEAADSKITLNGATLTGSGSTMSVNGLTLNLLEADETKEITINVAKDTSAVYDTIKDFLSEYNDILETMSTSYNADRAKGYNVLTDEQKESMSDDEVEKWNNKIKSSLLRRDDTLNGLITSFRNTMMGAIETSSGKKISLASLGITTSTDYKEGGLLHIKGDEDDDVYADETNVLKKMLEDDPDTVMEVLTGVATNLYNDLNKKMASTTYSSAFTFYNDKQMKTQMDTYKKDISNWETKLAALEDRYYSQFTAMEKALANLQSQQSSLSGFFG